MPRNGKNRNGDGLPFPDDATLAKLGAEARTARPKASQWGPLVALLRWAAEQEKLGVEDPALPPGMTWAESQLRTVCSFLQQQDCLMRHGSLAPLVRLLGEIGDLAKGRVSPMFKPRKRGPGRPRKGASEMMIMGLAARTVSELHEAGDSIPTAIQTVAAALGRRIPSGMLKDWREQIMGQTAPKEAIEHYLAALPSDAGKTPRQRANTLLNALRRRGGGVINSQKPRD